jgi:hypothetical protein
MGSLEAGVDVADAPRYALAKLWSPTWKNFPRPPVPSVSGFSK